MAESTAIGGHVKDLSDKYPGNFIPSKSGKVRVYHLDHAGCTLFSQDQLSEAQEALSRLSINPHSSSRGDSDALEHGRRLVLRFLNAPPGQYVCIFTAGATASLHLLAASFQWTEDWQLCYTPANHTSVLAMRSLAHEKGAEIRPVHVHRYTESCVLSCCADTAHPTSKDDRPQQERSSAAQIMLALPLECNVTGTRYSNDTLDALCQGRVVVPHISPDCPQKPLILLDAAKACQTDPPDLTRHPCHFVALSFYKIFGYPTGLGALLVRSDVLHLLQPPFLGGGSVLHVLPRTWPLHAKPRPAPAAFEAGTPHYQGVASLSAGFTAWHDQAESQGGAQRALELADNVAATLCTLKHSTGKSLCSVLGRYDRTVVPGGVSQSTPSNAPAQRSRECSQVHPGNSQRLAAAETVADGCHAVAIHRCNESCESTRSSKHGPVVAFVVWGMHGDPVSSNTVQECLAEQHVYVRAGCCCNPGACAAVLGLSEHDILQNVQAGWSCRGDMGVVKGRHTGVVRASFGVMSTREDADALISALVRCCADDGRSGAAEALSVAAPACMHNAAVVRPICGNDAETIASKHQADAVQFHGHEGPPASGLDSLCLPNDRVQRCAVAMVYVYPVKSLAGSSVHSWPVTAGGLLLDRAWAVVDRAGTVVNCARVPRLHLLKASVCLHTRMLVLVWQGLAATQIADTPHQKALRVAWPQCMQVEAFKSAGTHICPTAQQPPGALADVPEVTEEFASRWMSKFVGLECFLVHHCCRTWKASRGSVCCATHSNTPSASLCGPSAVLGQITVGAACSCLQREHVTEETVPVVSPRAAVESSAQGSPDDRNGQVAAEQQLLDGISSDHVQPSRLSGAFSNQAPMLFATDGSVRFAASLLRTTGTEQCRTAVLEDVAVASRNGHDSIQGHAACTAQDESHRANRPRTTTKEIVLGEQVMHEVVQRFRPNVVLSRLDAYVEAGWDSLYIEGGGKGSVERGSNGCGMLGDAQQLASAVVKFTVGEQAVRCKAINVHASSGTADGMRGGLYGALRRSCGPGKAVWGVYVWPCTDVWM